EHSRSKIREEHVEEGISQYESCVDCHRSGDEDEAERIWRSKRYGSGGYSPVESYQYGDRRHKRQDDD
ncbi:MAG: class III cytochrome C family protein, partial [Sedimenticolaceae bacterium]